MHRKSQSAMEYLMTYGWTILIIGVIIAILFSIGVFNLGNTSGPSSCIAIAGWRCNNPVLYSTGTLGFTTGEIGSNIKITAVSCTSSASSPVSIVPLATPISLNSGQMATLNVTCPITGSGIGTKFTGYLWLQYNNQYTSGIVTPIGRFIAYVQSGGSGPAAGRLGYVPITITNSQPIATGSSFQQMVFFNPSSPGYSANESADLGNIRFYQGSSELYSWCESGCTSSSSNAVFWIALPSGIAANSNTFVNMSFLPTSVDYDGVYAGEAPQLSPSYAKYDNGQTIFNFYDNFAGFSLSNKWSSTLQGSYAAAIISNGLTLDAFILSSAANWNSIALYSTTTFPQNSIADEYISYLAAPINAVRSSDPGFSSTTSGTPSADNNANPMVQYSAGITGYAGRVLEQGTSSAYVSTSLASSYLSNVIVSLAYTGSQNTWYSNYANIGSLSTDTPSGPLYLQLGVATESISGSYSVSSYWVRVRPNPPGGIMPSTAFGSISH